jgi:3',5'-cyclic AMP phosphodiesterase CpdA
MKTLLHMSDPHFGTDQPDVVEALVRLSDAQSPQLVILSGDITQRARPREFDAARAFIDRLGVPSLVIPGNHDIPLFDLATRSFAPYSRYRRVFGHELEPEFEAPDLLVVCVKTTRRYRHVDGDVSEEQIARVAGRLRRAQTGQLRIVVTHQPAHVTHEEDEKDLLQGGEEAILRWAEAGADLILGGHIHRPFVCALHERVAGVTRPVWAVQAGTALSSRTRADAGNSVNLIRYGNAQRCTVERWDYQPRARSFLLKDKSELNGGAGAPD